MILEKGKNVAVQQKPAIVCYLGTYIGVIKGLGTYTVNDEKMGQTSGQSYKASTIVIYDSRVIPDLKIPHITMLES